VKFDWDSNKDRANQKKHGVAFSTAKKVFQDSHVIIVPDEKHSLEEDRYIAYGMVKKILFVSYTLRYSDTIRIISARKATESEVNFYYDYNGMPRFK
jgi:hypothetical protein